jgi:uncharacterized protein (DUF488 family)
MKNSERVIFTMLASRHRPYTKTRFVKMMFLLRKEGGLENAYALYDFLPYKYGPFSFTLYRDMARLSSNGWIAGDRLQLSETRKTEALQEIEKLPSKIRSAVSSAETEYGKSSDAYLLNKVYSDYPEYTFMNEDGKKTYTRPIAEPAIYTIGYEGKSADAFLNIFLQTGIRRLVDVRSNAVSRKWGFSKRVLSDLCEKLDIEYVHIPQLGIQSSRRRLVKTPDDYNRLLDEYEHCDLPRRTEAVAQLRRMMEEKTSALVCMEADPSMCHRGRLADVLRSLSDLKVYHV